MRERSDDTIFALATAPGRAGVAIIRVSGPAAMSALSALCGAPPPPRYMSLRSLVADGDVIDRALVVCFEAGASYTGEDMCEFHVHGGRATVSAVLARLAGIGGLRAAVAGEFTRRALESGVMDLAQAEALADLVDAETEAQRQQALAVVNGALSSQVATWRQQLVTARALLEATIDFADEEDAPGDVSADVTTALKSVVGELDEAIVGLGTAALVREGYVVALVGPPNVGKSTLINAISGEDAAIVSAVAGTTRDVIRVATSLNGLPVTFLDMAGLRDARDEVEDLGVKRAIRHAQEADLRIFLSSADTAAADVRRGLSRPEDLCVWSKADLGAGSADISISAASGRGVPQLLRMVAERLAPNAGGGALFAHARHRASLEAGRAFLLDAMASEAPEIAAEHIREAARSLDLLVGSVDVEDVLGEIFSRFCIGK